MAGDRMTWGATRQFVWPVAVVTGMLIWWLSGAEAIAQNDRLRNEIARIAQGVNGRVGVGVLHLATRDTLTVNASGRFPMQSVYKVPIGLAVLHSIDKGDLSLDQEIRVTRDDYYPGTWSPLATRYPDAGVAVTLREILELTVSASDNNGCDILLRLLGGADMVDRYIHGLGVSDMSVVSTEREMHNDPRLQYENWSTPVAMTRLLEIFYAGKILSPGSRAVMWKAMADSPTGKQRLRGMLPPGTSVAHKTGTSGRDGSNIIGALNDVGIVVLPGGDAVAVVVFISDATDDDGALESAIARMAKSVFDYYTAGK